MHLGTLAEPADRSTIEILPVAWPTTDYMLPVLVSLNVFESYRARGEILKNFRSGTASPIWVGVGSLDPFLEISLQSLPLLLRRLLLHVRQ